MPSNTLLYILPDVTYFAELLPTKKEFTFAVQSFRQINGEFVDDNEFLAENIDKLFSKFKDQPFTSLILPDFLFTDTIVTVNETDEKAVIAHLKEKLLPSLGLTTQTHHVNTFVLTQFKGQSKVQISAIEKSLLAPIRVAAQNYGVSFEGVTALSWSAKSIISLEPSISILQVGSKLYSSLHYIGIDQTTVADLDEIPNIIETIKTLKGGEPSIQTIYLLSNAIVEEQLTEQLKSTLPIQQLASFKEEDSKMPSYIKQIIESGMKTLSIPDYLAPSFELTKATKDDEKLVAEMSTKKTAHKSDQDEDSQKEELSQDTAHDTLPTPTVPTISAAGTATTQIKQLDLSGSTQQDQNDEATKEDTKEVDTNEDSFTQEDTQVNSETDEAEEPTITTLEDDTKDTKTAIITQTELKTTESSQEEEETEPMQSTPTSTSEEETEKETAIEKTEIETTLSDADEIDLRKFSIEGSLDTDDATTLKNASKHKAKKAETEVIKNESGIGSMIRMVFITLAVFFATVAIGVGVGLGLLKVTQEKPTESNQVIVEETEQEPEATQEAQVEEVIEFDPSKGYSVLVVNATTKAGYAGTVKSDLTKASFEDVDAANAKGDYEKGNYVLVTEEIPGLVEYLEEATDLSLVVDTENKTDEDSSGVYDFVVVLAE